MAIFRFSLIFSTVVLFATAHAHAHVTLPSHGLLSPWDLRVASAGKVASGEPDGPACPTPSNMTESLEAKGYYVNGEVDESKRQAYVDNTARPRRMVRWVVDRADSYVTSGDHDDALCAASILQKMASENLLGGKMVGPQAYYFRTWMLNALAISWLKVRKADGVSEIASHETINSWLVSLAKSTADYFEGRDKRAGVNNLRYWAGSAAMASAIAADDQTLFAWALESFHLGVNAITQEGTLDTEMQRGRRALHYHAFAAGPLLLMAELGAANGVETYKSNDEALRRLVLRIFSGLQDPTFFNEKAGVPQFSATAKNVDIPWIDYVAERLDLEVPSSIRNSFKSRKSMYLGGLPPPIPK